MKKINEYRQAKHFNITATELEYLGRLAAGIKARGETLYAVVPTEGGTDGLGQYTVRVSRPDGALYDMEVAVGWRSVTVVNEVRVSMTEVERVEFKALLAASN